MEKGLNDNRNYDRFKLDNGLEVVIIEDNKLKTGIASMAVNCGSLNNPDNFLGLAHYLEHMLFMGSKKYPKENYFANQLNAAGGYSNAYTKDNATVYYFEVNFIKFDLILDIFAQFFISPLLIKDVMDREINAVNSEHSKNLLSNTWREIAVLKDIMEPELQSSVGKSQKNHFKKFSTGSIETLKKPGLREALIDFYKKYYVATNMKLVIIAPKDVKTLVKKCFSLIKPGKLNNELVKGEILKNKYNNLYHCIATDSSYALTFYWQIPDIIELDSAYYFVGDIFTLAMKENSIKWYLVDKGLITDIDYGIVTKIGNTNIMALGVSLVPGKDNMKTIETIIRILHNYLQILKTYAWTTFIKNKRKMAKLTIDYSDKISDTHYANDLSESLFYINWKQILIHDKLRKTTDKKIISFLDLIDLGNSVAILLSPKKGNNNKFQKEYYYGAEYKLIGKILTKDTIKKLNLKIGYRLFEKNSYIPSSVSLLTNDEKKKPEEIKINDRIEYWYNFTSRFNTPTAVIKLNFICPEFFITPKNYLLTKLFTRLINKNLEEKFDQALSAGYFFRFRALQSDGIVSLYLSGYNTNLHNLFNDLVMNILEMKLEKKELTRGILNMKNEIDNLVNDTPLGLVYTNLLEKTSRFFYSIKDLKKASRSIKPEDFLVWKKIFNLDMKVVILHGGNDIPLKGITFEKYLPSQALKIIDPFVFKPVNIEIQHPNKNESNTGIGYFYHVKMAGKAVATCALVELFTLLFSESFFNVMRTKNQFGYITRMSYYRYKYNFIVTQEIQTPLEDIEIIKEAIIKFNKGMKTYINNLTPKELEAAKENVMIKYRKPEKTLDSLLAIPSEQIISQEYDFSWKEKVVNEISLITQEKLLNFYYSTFEDNPEVISVIMKGENKKE